MEDRNLEIATRHIRVFIFSFHELVDPFPIFLASCLIIAILLKLNLKLIRRVFPLPILFERVFPPCRLSTSLHAFSQRSLSMYVDTIPERVTFVSDGFHPARGCIKITRNPARSGPPASQRLSPSVRVSVSVDPGGRQGTPANESGLTDRRERVSRFLAFSVSFLSDDVFVAFVVRC